jgi:hypothetical protein
MRTANNTGVYVSSGIAGRNTEMAMCSIAWFVAWSRSSVWRIVSKTAFDENAKCARAWQYSCRVFQHACQLRHLLNVCELYHGGCWFVGDEVMFMLLVVSGRCPVLSWSGQRWCSLRILAVTEYFYANVGTLWWWWWWRWWYDDDHHHLLYARCLHIYTCNKPCF